MAVLTKYKILVKLELDHKEQVQIETILLTKYNRKI